MGLHDSGVPHHSWYWYVEVYLIEWRGRRSSDTKNVDMSGVVVEVGQSVTSFKPGDLVIGFAHGLCSQNLDNCAFQTYVLVKANAAAIMPASMDFIKGASLPTAVGTATMCLADVFGLSIPGWTSVSNQAPSASAALLVWGGASAGVGAMTIQLARMAGLTVFATASKHQHSRLISLGATEVVDYHSPTVVDELIVAAERAGKNIVYAVDAISTEETLTAVMDTLRRSSKPDTQSIISHTTPWPTNVARPDDIAARQVRGDDLWGRREDLCAWLYGEALPKWLQDGSIIPSPIKTIEGGIEGIQNGLNELRKGVSGEKLVVRI